MSNIIPEDKATDPVFLEAEKYEYKRAADGVKAFYELMAELRLNSLTNNYPRAINKYIERKLRDVRNEVCLGQWLSAREYLDEVVVEGYLTIDLWERVRDKLDAYITENY